MKALSIRQPWASRIASGRKTIELRSWRTNYRGPILVLAGGRPWGKMAPEGPLGVAVCIVDLVDVRRAVAVDENAANIIPPEDWFAWVLENPRPVRNVPVKGRLGLYAPSAEVVQSILAA